MKINKAGLDLVKKFEGCYLKAYQCPAGVWTIGHGHTQGVKRGDTLKNEAEALELLQKDLEKVANGILPYILANINENQFSAFVSLAFNIGVNGFIRSTALRKFNLGDIKGAADAILMWNKATVNGQKKILKGLERRREAERELFLTPIGITGEITNQDVLDIKLYLSKISDIINKVAIK